jgi:ADP-ribose pyrophosphatase YjhB (NUDIX family)
MVSVKGPSSDAGSDLVAVSSVPKEKLAHRVNYLDCILGPVVAFFLPGATTTTRSVSIGGVGTEWLDWVRRLQAIAQSGLAYAEDPYDIERYEQVRRIAAEIAASRSEASVDRVEGLFCKERGYATPKLDIRAVVLDEKGAVLLVKEKEDGLWTLPGGWVDVGESPSEAAQREVKEETGYEVRAERLLALWDRDKHPHPPLPFHVYKLYFECELLGGEPLAASTETEEVGFFPTDALPELSLGRVTPRQIERLFEQATDNERGGPAEFD